MTKKKTSDPVSFCKDGYKVCRKLICDETASLVRRYMDVSLRAGHMSLSRNEVTDGQFQQYGAVLSETLLDQLRPRIQNEVGSDLLSTYSFWRVYQRGAQLSRHIDRKACEISVSVTVAVEPDPCDWPFFVRDLHGNEMQISLKTGDGLIYMGCDVPHWRNNFVGSVQYQMFLHYVRKHGPNAGYAFDGRSNLALPPQRT